MTKQLPSIKDMQSKEYRIYRLTKSSGFWLKFYQDRINECGKYDALIFPEMSFKLKNTDRIYYPSYTYENWGYRSIKIGLNSFGPLKLSIPSSRRYLRKIEHIEEFEINNQKYYSMNDLRVEKGYIKGISYITTPVAFLSRLEALRYINDEIEKEVKDF